MKKIISFNKIGGPEVLEFQNIEEPKKLKADEVFYEVKAFALNRSDWLLSAGLHYTIPKLPSRIGSEASGIVKAIGNSVTKFKAGDKVSSIPFFTTEYLVHGEIAITPEKYLVKYPENLSFVQATSVWMQYMTAYYPFVEIAKIKKNDVVLIGAASSSAGLAAIDIVKSCDGFVIATTRSEKKINRLREYGANEVIYTEKENLSDRIKDITRGRGIRAVYDPISNPFYQQYLDSLQSNSLIFHFGLQSGESIKIDLSRHVRTNSYLLPYSLFNYVRKEDSINRGVSYIKEKINKNIFKPKINKIFSFDETIKAYEYLMEQDVFGKIVVEINK